MIDLNILITGRPGVGKTTVLKRIKNSLEEEGYHIGGIICPEIKEGGIRVGFSIIDLANKRKGILSHIKCKGPKVGKYKVNLKDLNEIGVPAIENALKRSDYVMVDEIAPMELHSKEFQKAVEKAFDDEKPVLAVIHRKSTHPFISGIKIRDDLLEFEVTLENRDLLHKEILNILEK
ncbi:MAG: NTPase [Methanobacterium sp.]